MARAYGDDLRRKLLEAHVAGKGTLLELAERFGVSVGYAWKVSAALKRTKSMARSGQVRRGAVSKVDEDALRALVKRQPDLLLRELQAEMSKAGTQVSIAHLARVLKRLGLGLKKSRSMPASATASRTGNGGRSS